MQLASKFFADIVKSVGSSGVQLVIMMVTTPLMTRLYDPADYTSFGIINLMATVIIGIGMMSMANVYPMEKDPERRTELLQTMSLVVTILALLSALAAFIMAIVGTLDLDPLTLALLPILVFSFGTRQTMVSVATQHANFTSLAVGQIAEPITARSGSIALGALFSSNPVFILASVAAGHLVTALTVIKMAVNQSWRDWRTLLTNRPHPLTVIKRYSDFAIFNTPSHQALPLVMLAIQILIASFFTHDMAGHYILAVSILTLPASVIGLASAPVIYRKFIDIEHTNPDGLARYLWRAIVFYLVSGTLILSPIFFFGEEIFGFVFGKVWVHAGEIASILSIPFVGGFTLMGVVSIFSVTRRMKMHFFLEVITCAFMLIVIMLSFRKIDFDTAMFYLAIIWSIRNIMLLSGCMMAANRHAHPTVQVS
ncbi:MAG: lipopolysaccharide biosynthesis protein [Rickettsiales bacterium]